jgi:cytochrome d ubiquinol oxidase subunit II
MFMGTVVGAIAAGKVPPGNAAGDPVSGWLNPLSLVVGALFVATSAYLSAVFLLSDARRAGAPDLERYFTARALVAAVVAGAFAVAGIVVAHADARYLYDGLTHEGLPLVGLSALCGLASLELVRRGAARGTRLAAAGAVAAVIWAWGVAQYPYLLPQTLTISDGAAASATLTSVLIVFGVAVVLVLPAIALLFTLAQGGLIEESERPQPQRTGS